MFSDCLKTAGDNELMIEIGISGWTYDGWRGTFYPPKLPHHKELEFASRKLPSIEINGTFYPFNVLVVMRTGMKKRRRISSSVSKQTDIYLM